MNYRRNYLRITLLLLLGLSAWNLRADSPHIERSSTVVYVKGVKYYVHTVREGETLYSIARAYGVGEQTLLDENPAAAYGLKIDQNLKIPYLLAAQSAAETAASEPKPQMSDKKLRRMFDTHYICAGETLYSIARQYRISVETVMADNPDADPAHLTIGDALRIRKREIGSADAVQNRLEWESYKNNLNSVADAKEGYHIVASGETVYSLSRRYGISEEEFVRMNNLNDGLKAGSIVQVPRRKTDKKRAATEPDPTVTVCPEDVHEPDIFEPVVSFRPLGATATLDIALLLPLSSQGKPNANFMEFYQGFLIGLEDVKTQRGRSVRLTLFDTERDSLRLADIMHQSEFRSADLIVGPVYEEEIAQVTSYADRYRVPVVSPLASVESLRSNVLFQMAPDQKTKYDKVRELIEGKHITLVYGGNADKDYEREILALLSGRQYDRYDYKYVHPSSGRSEQTNGFAPILRNGRDNVMIVMADNETDVDRILASIASARLSLSSRGQSVSPFVVLGNSHWNRYNNIDRTIFFEDHVALLSSYNAKRDNAVVKAFDSRYAKAFGSLPSLYSYRGYDAAAIFAEGMYDDIAAHMEGRVYVPLQTPYMFRLQDDTRVRVNSEWALVQYNDDFTITTR